MKPHRDMRGGDSFLGARQLHRASGSSTPSALPNLGANELCKISGTWEQLLELAIGNFSL